MLKWTPNLELGLINNKFHKFWWFIFCRRTCWNNIENVPKVYKKYNNTNTQHEPKGEKAHNQAKQGPNERRTRKNPNQITSSPRQTHIGPLKRSKGVNPPKLGKFGLTGGAAAPRPNKPQTLQAASYHLSMVGCMGLAIKLMLRMAVWSI